MEYHLTQKPIRTFVRRQGRMTKAQREALHDLSTFYMMVDQENVLAFDRIFGNAQPVVLEIGFGMGDSLAQMAEQHPKLNFIGIEVHRPGIGALLKKLHERKISNIKIIEGDAIEILKQQIQNHSLDQVQIFFPDPWQKKRHHKRRMIQKEFVELVAQKLKPGGKFLLATDWQTYAEHMMEVLSACKTLKNTAGEGGYADLSFYRVKTKFENRGEKLGHRIFELSFER